MKFPILKRCGFAVVAVLFLLGQSCSRELKEGYGQIRLSVNADTSTQDIQTRSDDVPDVFAIDIILKGQGTVAHFDDHTQITEPIQVRAGKYEIRASGGTLLDAAFDAPVYGGSSDVTVADGQTATAEITCTLSNVKTSVTFDKVVPTMFKRYALEVSNGHGKLTFDSQDGTLDRIGYFSVTGKLDWKLLLTNNDGESFESISGTIPDVKARQYYRFNFTVDTQADGASAIRVTIDELTNDRDITIDIPIGKSPAPVLSGEGFDMGSRLDIILGSLKDRIVRYGVAAGLKDASLKHDSQEMFSLGVPYDFSFTAASSQQTEELAAAGVTWSSLEQGSKSGSVDISVLLSKLPMGSYRLVFATADNEAQLVYDTLNVQVLANVAAMATKSEPWAMFAVLTGEWYTEQQPSGLGFEYRKEGASQWNRQMSIETHPESNTFTATVYGLDPLSKYEFRTVSDNDSGKESPMLSFVTEDVPTIPNMNFDSWYKSGKTWYPKASASDQTWWDTANQGANVLSENNPTSPESGFVAVPGSGKNAARLETKSVLGVLAAGNLYTGRFKELQGTTAKLDFGVPFTGRPLGLKGYYSYAPKVIDKAQSPYEHMKGKTDLMQIYLMLTDWDSPFAVSSDGTFVSMDDPAIIAFGEIVSDVSTDGKYVPFKIKLEYRDRTRTPKHAVIICCASRYGDYFTGAVGSVLYVDEFELIYDPLEFEE